MSYTRVSGGAIAMLLVISLAVSLVRAEGPPPATVRLGEVVEEEVRQTSPVIGVLYYDRISEISTELAGLVDQIEVEEGNSVELGTVLVRLNTDILDKEIAYQRSRIEQVELQINNAKKQFERLQRLFDKSGVSEKEYDDALFNYRNAQLEKEALVNALQQLLVQKKRSVITAPFGGIILEKHVDSGSWVQPGSQLVTIGSGDDLFVRAPIAEKTLRFIERGQSVDLVLNAFDRSLTGTITDLDPVADLKTKNVFLKISIPRQPLVAENMSATVSVPVSDRKKLRIFSRAALIKFQGKDFVYTVKEGKAAILPVNIVTFLGDRVGVDTPYIMPGMKLVVEGNERLRPDQPVTVVGAE
ncbi:MAG: efflux RND transporter periplasmic adaptor subunit [Desulfobulbaceae bacterium]|nr:MAG: efflux RND transporter periplasmic adaptor subunit [Desulfobulbaceae bacterium]